MKTPILGSSYVARSVNAADNRMVNLFPEIVPEGGKEPAFLSRTPGLSPFLTIGSGPIRGMWVMADRLFVVSGNALYSYYKSGASTAPDGYVVTLHGYVYGTGDRPVSMTDNGSQLLIAADGPAYVYDVTYNTFTQITDPDFQGASSVAFLDGFFVYNKPNSQSLWVSSYQDGTMYDFTEQAFAEGSPDNIVGLIVDHKELWVFGKNSTEVWYNAGNAGFPFAPIQGAFTEIGCASQYSIAKMDNTVYWLSSDARGQGIVYRARGYNGERISTHAVEWQIQQYGDISDAVAYTYQQDGHSFYVLNFPSANATWVYDAATGAWHERAGFENGQFVRHRGNCQAFFRNRVLIGDYETNTIYEYDLNVYTDNGIPQRWLRSWRALPPDANNLKRSAHHSLQLDCEAGVGLNSGQGSNPQVALRWSDDGGHTWSNERWASLGAIGEFGRRVIWRRLGMTNKLRDRVYEVSGTDPVKITILGAELEMSATNA